jgi:hypothetical protein
LVGANQHGKLSVKFVALENVQLNPVLQRVKPLDLNECR